MPAKKIIVAILIIVVAIGGFVAGLVLIRQRQDLEDEAAVVGGQATVSITPQTGNYEVGDSITVSVHFNPSNIAISSVGVRLAYPFTGVTPEITVSEIDINPSFLSSADWTCPTQTNPRLEGGNVVFDIACANTGFGGFTANTDTLLANITLFVERPVPTNINPLILRFDASTSMITRESDKQDILLIPQSTGSYTISSTDAQATATPTPTGIVNGDDLTSTPTLTPTSVSTISATPTTADQLPDAGVSLPTIMGAGVGIILILAALVLAL
jgi:hypothetical protein